MAINSPKHSQETWNTVRLQYETGSYKSLKELSAQYSISPSALRTRIWKERWGDKQSSLLDKARQNVVAKTVDLATEYLSNSFKRVKRFESLIDKAIDQTGELVEPTELDSLSKTEARIFEMGKSCLRIPTVASVDVTTKGQSIGESIVSAISKLRDGSPPKLTSDQVSSYIDVEILPKSPSSS